MFSAFHAMAEVYDVSNFPNDQIDIGFDGKSPNRYQSAMLG